MPTPFTLIKSHGARLPWYRDLALFPTIALVVAADQITKHLVRTNLRLGESWPGEGVVRLTHGTNSGSVFGLFPDQTLLLIVASIIAIAFLVYFYRAHALSRLTSRIAIGLLLGGALGNLIDRLRAGTVVDFIDLGWWPIFNLADSSIVVGMILLVSATILTSSKRTPPSSGDDNSADSIGS